MEDTDTHLCLVCQEKIVGLMNYVAHKQTKCASKTEKQIETSTSTTSEENQQDHPVAFNTGKALSEHTDDEKNKLPVLPTLPDETAQAQQLPEKDDRSSQPNNESVSQMVLENIQENGPYTLLSKLSQGGVGSSDVAEDAPPLTGGDGIGQSVPDATTAVEQSVPNEHELSLDIQQLNKFINEDFSHTMSHQDTTQSLETNSATSPSTDAFFRSLELQSRKSPKKTKSSSSMDNRNLYGHFESLSISNFLNNLDFSSDEDLTNFDDLDDSDWEESNIHNPPRSHTGGKWKPGEYPGTRSRRSIGKKIPGGKWKPGMLAKPVKVEKKKKPITFMKDGVKMFTCEVCNLTFDKGVKYSAHFGSRSHKEKAAAQYEELVEDVDETTVEMETEATKEREAEAPQTDGTKVVENKDSSNIPEKEKPAPSPSKDEKEAEMEENVEDSDSEVIKNVHICTICDKKYSRKYEIVQHLMTRFHKNRSINHPEELNMMIKYERYVVKLSSYQCAICQFYFNRHSDFLDHVATTGHIEKCESSMGELTCLLCRTKFETANLLKIHLEGPEHMREVKNAQNSKICVIKDVVDLTCKYCGVRQASVKRLKKHIQVRHKDGKKTAPLRRKRGGIRPKCPHCDYVAPYQSALDVHIRRIHSTERPYNCRPCKKKFVDKYSYEKHLQTSLHERRERLFGNGEKVYVSWSEETEEFVTKTEPRSKREHKCEKCDYRTVKYTDLRQHCLDTHKEEVTLCKVCNVMFLSVKAYRVHCSGKTHQTNLGLSGDTTNADGKKEEIFECPKCQKKFSDVKWMNLHIQFYHNHMSSEEELQKIQGNNTKVHELYGDHLEQIRGLPLDTSVSCPECGKFVQHERIVEHLRLHTNEKPFICNLCNRGFVARLSLRRHLMVHVGLTENTCNICNREFKRYNSYRVHMELHKSQETHICSYCGQTFPLAKQLNHHMKRHGERTFQCPIPSCTWSFILKNELNMHMLTHTGEKKYLCDTCGFAAATKSRLQRHTKTHTGEREFHCEYCTYKAGNRTHLKRHMRIHIGSKPFQCPYCSYSCNTHENIRKHITKTKKHEGLPIYPCTFCKYGTNSTKEFRAHLITEHKDKVNLDGLDKLAEYSGLYKREEDPPKPIEGKQILPTKERHGTRNPKNVEMQISSPVKEALANVLENEGAITVHQESQKLPLPWSDSTNYQVQEIKNWDEAACNIPTVAYQTEISDQKMYHVMEQSSGNYSNLTPVSNYDILNVVILDHNQFPQN